MKRILLAFLLLVGACASVPANDMVAASKAAYTAKATLDGLVVIAGKYNGLPRCGAPTSPVLCSSQPVVDQLRKAALAGDAATQSAENAVRTLGTSPDVVNAAVTAATSAVGAFQQIVTTYNLK